MCYITVILLKQLVTMMLLSQFLTTINKSENNICYKNLSYFYLYNIRQIKFYNIYYAYYYKIVKSLLFLYR